MGLGLGDCICNLHATYKSYLGKGNMVLHQLSHHYSDSGIYFLTGVYREIG